MANIDPLLERNQNVAAPGAYAGGRVTPEVIGDVAYMSYLSDTVLRPEGPLFEITVLHHTRCGTGFLADPAFRSAFAGRIDAERLRSTTIVSPRVSVSGHVYDADTGLTTTIVPAPPLHADPPATGSGSSDVATLPVTQQAAR